MNRMPCHRGTVTNSSFIKEAAMPPTKTCSCCPRAALMAKSIALSVRFHSEAEQGCNVHPVPSLSHHPGRFSLMNVTLSPFLSGPW